MYISDRCAECLYDKQKARLDEEDYLREVRKLLNERRETDTAPYMVHQFNLLYEERCGKRDSYAGVKRMYNDLVLSMEKDIKAGIREASDPLARALAYARIGNYIDFGAMNYVDKDTFLALFQEADLGERDLVTYVSFLSACENAEEFLLIADNCGEIVMDKLLLKEIRQLYPQIEIISVVRGGEVLNDVTMEDAEEVGLAEVARILSNGDDRAGTCLDRVSEECLAALQNADVLLAKGQGNFETLLGCGLNVFYLFLCKCDHFRRKFHVPVYSGMIVREQEIEEIPFLQTARNGEAQ